MSYNLLLLAIWFSATEAMVTDEVPAKPETLKASATKGLEPTVGTKHPLLLEEKFDGSTLPKEWNVKSGELRVADGCLRASQTATGDRLCLFNFVQPMQDAAIQIDFRFE